MPKALCRELWETIHSGNTWCGELQNHPKSGTSYRVDTTISPDYDAHNNIIGYTSVRHDISDRKRVDHLCITDPLTQVFSDFVFRLGGEEFGMLFQGLDPEKSLAFARQLCRDIEALQISHASNSASAYVTVSIGVVTHHGAKLTTVDNSTKKRIACFIRQKKMDATGSRGYLNNSERYRDRH